MKQKPLLNSKLLLAVLSLTLLGCSQVTTKPNDSQPSSKPIQANQPDDASRKKDEENEAAKQEAAKQEAAKQEAAKQEAAKQEAAKQEAIKAEKAKQAKIEEESKKPAQQQAPSKVNDETPKQNSKKNNQKIPTSQKKEGSHGFCKDGTATFGNPSAKGKANSCYGRGGWKSVTP